MSQDVSPPTPAPTQEEATTKLIEAVEAAVTAFVASGGVPDSKHLSLRGCAYAGVLGHAVAGMMIEGVPRSLILDGVIRTCDIVVREKALALALQGKTPP